MKKSVVKKIKKSCQGVMSIFLCILVTPFVSIACGLVEVYRYQSAVQTYRDVVDTTQFSSLANADEYLRDRFGLFAMSQQEDDDVFGSFLDDLNENLSIMGNAITTGDIEATGKNALSNPEVLKAQIKDNAEISVPVKMLKDIVDSTGVIDNLKSLFSDDTKKQFEKIEKGVNAADAIATTLDDIVELINDIKESISDMKTEEFEQKTNEFVQANHNFLIQLYNDNFDYHTTDSDADTKIENILKNSTYFAKIKDIYNKAKSLSDDDGIYAITKGKLESIMGIADSFDDIKDAIEKLNEKDDDEKIGFEDIIEGLSEQVEEAADDFKKDEFKKYIDLLDGFISDLNTLTKLENSNAKSYDELTSDADKDNMNTFVKNLMTIYHYDWNNSSLSESERNQKLDNSIKNLYGLDNGLLGFSSFANSQSNAIDTMNELITNFMKDTSDSVSGFLDTFIDIAMSIFELHTLFNENLNSVLSEECVSGLLKCDNNPFQKLVKGLNQLKSGIKNVTLQNGVSFEKFFEGLNDLFEGAKSVISSISEQVIEKFDKIQELFSSDLSDMYEELLIDGYIVNNLPNRTNARGTNTSVIMNSVRVKLDGESLTGYKYEDIITQADSIVVTPEEYQSILDNMGNIEYGNDTMFKGAEAEYVLAGTSNEIFNQAKAFFDVWMLRLVSNIAPVIGNEMVSSLAEGAGPFFIVVYILFILLESYIDTILLVNGSDVPLIKLESYLSAKGLPVLTEKIVKATFSDENIQKVLKDKVGEIEKSDDKFKSSDDSSSKKDDKVDLSKKDDSVTDKGSGFKEGYIDMDYSAYLLFALKLGPTVDTKLTRLANIIQLETDSYYRNEDLEKILDEDLGQTIPGGSTIPEEDKTVDKGSGNYFKSDKAYTTITTTSKVTFNPFISVLNISDNSIFTKIYSQDLSY